MISLAKRVATALLPSLGLLAGLQGAALAGPAPVRLASAYDLSQLGRDFPAALETFGRADAAAAAGRPEEALALFEQAERLAPQSPAPARRSCELLTELGRADAALAACQRALKYGDAPDEYRALVGVLMMPQKALPTTDELFHALVMANGLAGNHPHLPAGHAALFDVALRLGDRRLMRGELRELERVAPDHYETGRAQRIVASLGPGWAVLAGWSLLALACALTLGRGLLRLRTRAGLVARTALALVAVLAGGRAHADEQPVAGHIGDFQIDDADPESSIPDRAEFRKDPVQFGYLIMDLADRADIAIKRKDYEAAIRYYRALIKTVPDRAVGYGKVCEVYELAGDRTSALPYCRRAMTKEGVRADDYERFVRLLLHGSGPVADADKNELLFVIDNLRKSKDTAANAADLECRLAVRVSDVARLQRCTRELATLAPEDNNNIAYQWSLALLERDHDGARRLLAKAKQAGLDVSGLERMTQASRQATVTQVVSFASAGALILAAVLLFTMRRRRETPATLAERSAS